MQTRTPHTKLTVDIFYVDFHAYSRADDLANIPRRPFPYLSFPRPHSNSHGLNYDGAPPVSGMPCPVLKARNRWGIGGRVRGIQGQSAADGPPKQRTTG